MRVEKIALSTCQDPFIIQVIYSILYIIVVNNDYAYCLNGRFLPPLAKPQTSAI